MLCVSWCATHPVQQLPLRKQLFLRVGGPTKDSGKVQAPESSIASDLLDSQKIWRSLSLRCKGREIFQQLNSDCTAASSAPVGNRPACLLKDGIASPGALEAAAAWFVAPRCAGSTMQPWRCSCDGWVGGGAQALQCCVGMLRSLVEWYTRTVTAASLAAAALLAQQSPGADVVGADDASAGAGGEGGDKEAALLESWKAYKTGFQQGIALFNKKPKKGIAFMQEQVTYPIDNGTNCTEWAALRSVVPRTFSSFTRANPVGEELCAASARVT